MTQPALTAHAFPMDGLTLPEAIETAKARGYQAVETLGGPIPIDSWNPYAGGWARFGLRFRFVHHPQAGPVLWEVAPPGVRTEGLAVGVWKLLRAA